MECQRYQNLRGRIFVDAVRGKEAGPALTAQDGAFDSEVEAIAPVDLNVTGLRKSAPSDRIRYKDDNNTWGEVLYQTVHVYDPNPNVGGSGGGGAGGLSAGSYHSGSRIFCGYRPGKRKRGPPLTAQDGAFDSEVETILPRLT